MSVYLDTEDDLDPEEYEPTVEDLEDAEREYYEALLEDEDFWPEGERVVEYDEDLEYEELD